MFAIVTDSCSSLSVEEVEALGATVCPLVVTFGEESYRDGFDLTPAEFYRKMAAYAPQGLPKTACPSPGDFTRAYKDALTAGAEGVVCITIAQGVSGTYNAACVGATACESGRVAVLNVKDTTAVEAVVIEAAAKLRDAGVGFAEAVQRLQALCDKSRSYYAFDTIENVVKGRPTADLEKMDEAALKVKPIIYLDDEKGAIQACGKERTVKALFAREVELVCGFVEERPMTDYEVRIAHGNAPERAARLKELLEERGIACSSHAFGWVGSVIGTYCGEKSVVAGIYPKELA